MRGDVRRFVRLAGIRPPILFSQCQVCAGRAIAVRDATPVFQLPGGGRVRPGRRRAIAGLRQVRWPQAWPLFVFNYALLNYSRRPQVGFDA